MEGSYLTQHPIDAIADAQETLLRLEVNIGGGSLDGVREERGNEAHHRLRISVAGRLQALVIDLASLDLVQDAVDRKIVAVVLVDSPADFALAREPRLQRELPAQLRTHLVQRHDVVRVGNRDDELACLAVERDREDGVSLGEFARHELQRHRVDNDLREVHALQAELFGQGVAQRRLGHEAQIYEELSDGLMGLELLEQRDPQLILGEDPLRNQDLPDMALGLRGNRLSAEARGIHREGYLLSSCTRSRARAGSKLAARRSVRASARW